MKCPVFGSRTDLRDVSCASRKKSRDPVFGSRSRVPTPARFMCPGWACGMESTGLPKPEMDLRDALRHLGRFSGTLLVPIGSIGTPDSGKSEIPTLTETGKWARRSRWTALSAVAQKLRRRIPLRGQAQVLAPNLRSSTLDCALSRWALLTLNARSQRSLRPLGCNFPMALEMKKSPATPLERTLTRKRTANSFGIHSYKFKGLKLPCNDIVTKIAGGWGLPETWKVCKI